jgi:hypothetical protein
LPQLSLPRGSSSQRSQCWNRSVSEKGRSRRGKRCPTMPQSTA